MKKRNIVRIFVIALLLFIYIYPTRYKFLLLNVTLAYIPIEIGYLVENEKLSKSLRISSFILWLLFLPNTVYLLTDLIHLRKLDIVYPTTGQYKNFMPLWRDFCLLVGSVLSLNIIGFHSIESIVISLRKEFNLNRLKTITFTLFLFLLSSIGVYMGRFLRLHSIHAITDLKETVVKAISMFDIKFFNFVIIFSLLQIILYYLIHINKEKQLD